MPRSLVHTVLLLPGLLALAGCTSVKALEGPPQDLRTLYQTSVSGPVLPVRAVDPRTVQDDDPVPALLQPPRVQKVWVPARRTPEGDVVTGHWTYLLLEAPQWRLDPPATASLPLPPLPPVPTGAPGLTAPAVAPAPTALPPARFPPTGLPPGVLGASSSGRSGPGRLPTAGTAEEYRP